MSRRLLVLFAFLVGVAAAPAAMAQVVIEIDKSSQSMAVSVGGETRWIWPVSTGRHGHDTPAGAHRAFRMEEDHFSKEWDEAPMPHSIFFTPKGHAIHGSFDIKRLGTPASHGCVRLHPEHAARLFALVQSVGVLKTTVVISGALPPPGAPAVARRPLNITPEPGRLFGARPFEGDFSARRYEPRDRFGAEPHAEPRPEPPRQLGWPFNMQ